MSITSDLQKMPLSNTPQPQGLGAKIGNFAKSTAQSIGRPFYKAGAMAGNAILGTADAFGLLSPTASANLKNVQQNGMQDTPFGNVDVPTVNTSQGPLSTQNVKAIKSSAGTGLEIGAMLGGGEVAPGKGLVQGAIQGAKAGAIIGGGQGAGQSLENNQGLGDTLKNTATGALAGGATGGVLGGVTGGLGNIWEKAYGTAPSTYDTNLANATNANNQAGANATDSIHEASSTVNDMMTGAGNQYDQVPKMISQADPNARTVLSKEIVDKLNALKDTKAWSLPSYIREPGLPSNIENIGSGEIKLNPADSQDLVKQLNDLKFNSKGDVVVNQQASNLVSDVKSATQAGMGHVTDNLGNSVWSKMSQDYQQASDARDAMSSLIPIRKFQGEILDPTEVASSVDKMMKMLKTPEGTAALARSNAEIKATTGYDILNDPMGSINKLAESNKNVAEALKGNFGHQFMQGLKNPNALSRRTLMVGASAVGALLGIVALSTAFRKQIGGFISGQ